MNRFLTENTPFMKCMRTIVQGILGVIVAELPQILGLYQLDPVWTATIAALVMAILSPIMAAIGDAGIQEITLDDYSGLPIRKTDNSLKECDQDAPQGNNVLSAEEIAALLKEADNGNA